MSSFTRFIREPEQTDVSLAVVNRTAPRPVQDLLEKLFDGQSVTVEEADRADAPDDMVYLLKEDEVVERSPLGDLTTSILTVNSDLYTTGTRSADDIELPAVIAELTDTYFRLRGYPESNKEKLLLIAISRHIERLSLEHDAGKHRASFQRLSRIHDERGTRTVYERLADAETDTHVYGLPDWTPPPELPLTMHGGWGDEFKDTWFVLHVPDDETRKHAALVALEREPRTWDSLWTYDPDRVRAINRHVEREL